jgi:hypothetical protein
MTAALALRVGEPRERRPAAAAADIASARLDGAGARDAVAREREVGRRTERAHQGCGHARAPDRPAMWDALADVVRARDHAR